MYMYFDFVYTNNMKNVDNEITEFIIHVLYMYLYLVIKDNQFIICSLSLHSVIFVFQLLQL